MANDWPVAQTDCRETCTCGARSFDEHLARVIGGEEPHPHPFGDPDNWTR